MISIVPEPLIGTLSTEYAGPKIPIELLLFNLPNKTCEFFPTNSGKFMEEINLNAIIPSIYIEIDTEENTEFTNNFNGVFGLVVTNTSIQYIEPMFELIPTDDTEFTLHTPESYKQLVRR